MKLSQLLITIGAIALAAALLSFVLKIGAWVLHVALYLAAIFIIAGMITNYIASLSEKNKDK